MKKYYDLSYNQVNYEGLLGFFTNFYHRTLEKKLTPKESHSKVLEVGGGEGQHLRFVKHKFNHYIISDISIDSKKINYSQNVKFINSNLENLSFQGEVFDRVISTCVLHHLDNPVAGLFELRRVTKSGGLISLYVPCDPGFLYRIIKAIITVPKQKKIIKRNKLALNPFILNTIEHKSNIYTLKNAINFVFKEDDISTSRFPFAFLSWNFNLFFVYQIEKE